MTDQSEPPLGDIPTAMRQWGTQTIFYSMQVKARSAGKSPLIGEHLDLVGKVAADEAERLFALVPPKSARRPEDLINYFESLLRWCQEHMEK